MPSEYIIEAAQKAEVWSNDRGSFQSWSIRLMDGKGSYDARANTRVGNDFPAVGEKVQGDLVPGPKGVTFKRSYNSGGASGGGFQRDPAERASIVRQHSQHMAIMWAACLMKVHTDPPMKPNYEWLKGVIDWFDRDAKGEPQP